MGFRYAILALATVLGAACGNEYNVPVSVNSSPVVAIVEPADLASFQATHSVELVGRVLDDNGLLDVEQVVWTSSLDGVLGREGEATLDVTGHTRVATTLSSGVHTITLEAIDHAGHRDTASISVLVDASSNLPTATIVEPGPFATVWLDEPVSLVGTVSDPNQPASTLQVTWQVENTGGGTPTVLHMGLAAADGSTSALIPSAQLGTWRVSLVARDADNNETTAQVVFQVLDPQDVDQDGDGWTPNQGDCDDEDASVHPGRAEVCNGIDDDCSGEIDDKDLDNDGYIDEDCVLYTGLLPGGDCDDGNPWVYPGAPELPDGLDNNCNGDIDEGTAAFDYDGDCWCPGPIACTGSSNSACLMVLPGDCDDLDPTLNGNDFDGDGYSTCGGDCDDNDASLNLDDADGDGWTTCDGDCDDNDPSLNLDDLDRDGYSTCDGDCDDTVAFLTPADNDSDGHSTCEGDCDDSNAALNIRDMDGDGYTTCEGDCDDFDPSLNLDDLDNDGWSTCAGDCDDDDPHLTPADLDGDGYSTCDGDCNDNSAALNLDDADGDGWTTCDGDCNDAVTSIHPGAEDYPDASFLDSNCDGFDGDLGYGVFVSASQGTDVSNFQCSHALPCRTLRHGLTVASMFGIDRVYVQAGTYTGGIDLVHGVSIWGGYSASWSRSFREVVGHTVRIRGGYVSADAEYITVRARSVTSYLADLIIEGPNAFGVRSGTRDGRSSYAVHAVGGTVRLERVTVEQGNGANGLQGVAGTNATQSAAQGGSKGANGQQGANFCDTTTSGGGARGTNSSCSSAHGGSGGRGGAKDTKCSGWLWEYNWNATSGSAGNNATTYSTGSYGWRGAGGGTCSTGGAGRAGTLFSSHDGGGGSAGQRNGRLYSSFWYGFSGGGGGSGVNHGTGGGGGGGSGGCDTGIDSRGAGGGGGGAGGCRATSGPGGGGAGGGSFGVFGVSATLDVRDVLFYRGSGGSGGKGGTAGRGQPGGVGGAGGNAAGNTGPGGRGGDGSRGGHTGAGGGGAGGGSYAIFRQGGSWTILNTTYQGGSGGSGGPGGDTGPGSQSRANGSVGQGGLVGATYACSSATGC